MNTLKTDNNMLEQLRMGEVLVSDGATGTYLQGHGLEPGGCPEFMNVTHPEVVSAMARDYFAAGSDFVLTNSFGGNRFMLEKYGHGGRVREFNRVAAELATGQADETQHVVGSVGPTGEFLQPLGDVDPSEMYEAFCEQITSLEAGGCHGVIMETMTALEEVTLAVRAARENTGLTVMASMVYDKGPRGFFTMMGVTPERGVSELEMAGVDVVGTNCGNGIEVMVELARQVRAAAEGYVIVQSNAGIPAIKKGQIVYPESPDYMAPYYRELVDIGVNLIGGCCGTTPDHIRAIAGAVRD